MHLRVLVCLSYACGGKSSEMEGYSNYDLKGIVLSGLTNQVTVIAKNFLWNTVFRDTIFRAEKFKQEVDVQQ